MASIADLISNLKKKLKDGYNGVADALPIVPNTSQIKSFASNPVQFMSNPSYNGGNNLYRTTPFKIGAQVQNFIESPKRTYDLIPEIKVDMGAKTPTANMVQGATNFALNLPINMAKYIGSNVIDTATDAGANIGRTITGRPLMGYEQVKSPVTRLGYQAAQGLLKLKAPTDTKLNAKEVIGNLGEEANVLLDASAGNFAKSLAKNAVKQGGKRVVLDAIKRGAIEGGTMGGVMGLTQGLGENRKTSNNLDYARNVLTSLAGGALAGTTFGATIGGGSAYWNKLVNRVQKINPNLTKDQATSVARSFVRDELGRFTGVRKPKTEPLFYGDIREAYGLPRNGDYQSGFIDLNAKIGGEETPPGRIRNTLIEEAKKYKSAEEFVKDKINKDYPTFNIRDRGDINNRMTYEVEANNNLQKAINRERDKIVKALAKESKIQITDNLIPANTKSENAIESALASSGSYQDLLKQQKNLSESRRIDLNKVQDRFSQLTEIWNQANKGVENVVKPADAWNLREESYNKIDQLKDQASKTLWENSVTNGDKIKFDPKSQSKAKQLTGQIDVEIAKIKELNKIIEPSLANKGNVSESAKIPVTPQEKLILKQPREEKIAMGMLKKGTITDAKYNEIAGREGFRSRPLSENDLEKQVFLEYQKTKNFKKAENKFWEVFGYNRAKSKNEGFNETKNILSKYQKNSSLLNPTQGIPSGRTSNTHQGVINSKQSQAPSQSQISQPQLPPQQPKSGISKIGQPPAQSSSQGIIESVKNYANQLYTQAVDRFNPLSQAAKQAGQGQAMRNAITQHYGAGSTATYHVDFELSPILKEVNADDLRSYTIAKRDLELAGRNIKGSDKATAQSVIDGLKQKYGADFTKIETAAGKLYSYQDSLVKKYLVETGIISKQNYEAMRRNNQAYIPFKRVMDQVDGFLGVTPQTKSMGSVSSQGVIKRIEGSDRDIIDPLQSIIENTYKIVSVGQRNRVAKAIVSLKDGLPGLVKPFTGEIGNRQDIISVFENGKVQKYQVPKDVAEAAKGLNEESLNALIKILAVPSKLVRATATGINPEFLIPNVTRDVQSAFVNVGLNPLRFVSGVAHLVKKDKVYQDFLRAGGKTSSIMIDRPYLKQTVGEITGKPGIEALNPIRLLQTLGEYSEQPTRIAMFEQTKNKLIKQGLSVAEAEVRAANAAQEGTVNFARMGSKMKAANALVTFLNARLQGADVLIRNVKNNPAGTLFRLGLITQVPAVLSYLYNRQFESYNDERVVSKYDKQNNFILMLSDAPIPSLNGAQFVKIPKGDVGRFANPTENFLSYLDGKGDSNTILEIAKAFGGLSPFQNIGDAIPAAIKPPIEWAANKSFFTGQPLVPEYKQALPEKYQYTSKTAPLYKIIGDKLNVSPAKLENTAAGYLTGFEKMGNAAFNALTGQKPDGQQGSGINRVPIARRFLGGEKRTSDEQNIIDDKRAKSIDFQVNDIKSAVNRGDIPMNDGVKQIELLRQQQQDIRNKQTVTTPTTNTGTADTIGTMGKTYYFKDAEGKLKEISISAPITAPDLTGNTELDKKLISKYNGKLTSRANDIASLFEAGQIKADEAEKMLSELMTKKISTAKGKTIKIGKVPKIKTPKVKLAKVKSPKIKIPKLKLARAKAVKIKLTKPKNTKIKLAMGGSKA